MTVANQVKHFCHLSSFDRYFVYDKNADISIDVGTKSTGFIISRSHSWKVHHF
jgi:hypothetical protein